MHTWEDIHARLFTRAILDDVMSQSELTKIVFDLNYTLVLMPGVNMIWPQKGPPSKGRDCYMTILRKYNYVLV